MRQSRGSLERQRARIRELLDSDPNRSSRSIAKQIGCSAHTVIRVRELHEQQHIPPYVADGVQVCNGAARHSGSANLTPTLPGNSKAVSHGAWSETRVGPLRERYLIGLRQRFPLADEGLLNTQANRAAQLELLQRWIDEHGVVRGARAALRTRPWR